MKFERYSKYRFNNGVEAKNRIVVPPMASQTADSLGYVTEKTVAHYECLSLSGAGIVFAEYSYVHPSGKSEPNQLGVHDNGSIEGLAKIAKVIHSSGALAGIQLVHAGGKTLTSISKSELMAPSAVRVPVRSWEPGTPREMQTCDIEAWKKWFEDAAVRAISAGFDFVELHAAHGYGLNQWLSPLTNQRTDEYGGSVKGRSRLLVEIVRGIRSRLPTSLISVRVPGQDHAPGGLTINDMAQTLKLLEAESVDIIHVSSGIGGWQRPGGRQSEGYLVADAALLKKAVALPVIGVGGIESGAVIDQFITERKIDFAAVGRAILKQPSGWRAAHLAPDCGRTAI